MVDSIKQALSEVIQVVLTETDLVRSNNFTAEELYNLYIRKYEKINRLEEKMTNVSEMQDLTTREIDDIKKLQESFHEAFLENNRVIKQAIFDSKMILEIFSAELPDYQSNLYSYKDEQVTKKNITQKYSIITDEKC